MVLKIATGTGWVYIDGIVEINTRQYTTDSYNACYGEFGRRWDAQFLVYHHHVGGEGRDENNILDNEPGKTPLTEVWFKYKHGEAQSYLLDTETYLMSDEGKTIERIN